MFKMYNSRSREVILLYLILIFSIILLLLVSWLVNQKFSQTAYNFKKISEGRLLVNKVNDVENELSTMGYSVRLYLAHRDTARYTQLPAFHRALTDQISDIRAFILSYPDQTQSLLVDSLAQSIELRFALLRDFVNVPEDSFSLVNNQMTLQNSILMHHITDLTSAIKSHENAAIESYTTDTASGLKTTSIMALGTTLLCVSVILFALFRLNAEVRHGAAMQKELKAKVLELDRSNSDLERFAYVASHDLHEPLRKLFAFSEILIERENGLSDDGKQIIHRMHIFVTRMQQLIDDLLAFSLTISKVEKNDVNLNHVLKNTITNLADTIAVSHATFDIDRLPDSVVGFESQLNQVFQNIISNAIKYARTGVPPHIVIRAAIVTGAEIDGVREEDIKKPFHKITFADNGIGFDNKYREKIFVIFQRLHGKSEYGGTGIGLATCMRVVGNHGGYIAASGIENQGAVFTIYLPVA